MSRRVGIRTIGSLGGKVPVPPPPFAPNPPYVAVRPDYMDSNDFQLPRSNGRCTFYAGRFWIFFREIVDSGCHVSYVSSVDGKIWTVPTRVYDFLVETNGRFHNVLYKNGYVHLVVLEPSGTTRYVYYRRGAISGSTIVWEPWRTVTSSTTGTYMDPTIAIDDQGYLWITYSYNIPYWYSPGTPYAVKATALDGSSWDIPFELTSVTYNPWFTHIGSFGSQGKMYAVYWADGRHMFGRYFNGSSWEAEEDITLYNVYLWPDWAAALVQGGKVYIVYKRSATELRYRIRDGSWGTEGIITTDASGEGGYSLVLYGGVLYLHAGYSDSYPCRYTYENGVWSSRSFPWEETTGPTELFYDYCDSIDNWDPISGTWVIEAGELSGEHTTHGVCVLKDLVWNPNWKDIWLTCTIVRKSPGGGDSGVIFRYKDENNYYRAYIDGTYIGFMKMKNGIPSYPTNWRVPFSTSLESYYTIQIRIKENIFEVYTEYPHQYHLTVIDDDPIPSGKAGCGVNSEHAHFDDFGVYKWVPWCDWWGHRTQLNEKVLSVAFQASSSLYGGAEKLILFTWSVLA